MIYDIIQQHQSELKLYRSQVKYYGFSEKLYEQIQDFKKYAVTPQQLSDYISENDLQTRTKHKLQDIALVYKHLEDIKFQNNYNIKGNLRLWNDYQIISKYID